MSKASRKKQRSHSSQTPSTSAGEAAKDRPALQFKPPLRPSRKMFMIAAGLLAVWLGLLLMLYVTAILPEKQKTQSDAPKTAPSLPGTVAR